jgi:hypothetical protein
VRVALEDAALRKHGELGRLQRRLVVARLVPELAADVTELDLARLVVGDAQKVEAERERPSATLNEPSSPRSRSSPSALGQRPNVYDLIASGELPAFRVGGQLPLSRDVLAGSLAEQATKSDGS